MHALESPPPDVELAPIEELVVGRPASWQGLSVDWSRPDTPSPVFLRRFVVPAGTGESSEVQLFGARYELAEALLAGEPLGEGHFVEYLVAQRRGSGGWAVHRLLQHASVTFSESAEPNDYVRAAEIADPRSHSIAEPPRWESLEDAVWPTDRDGPMRFIGQVEVPGTDVTRTFFTWDITAYLFGSAAGDLRSFKVVQQDLGAQSAEQHYASE